MIRKKKVEPVTTGNFRSKMDKIRDHFKQTAGGSSDIDWMKIPEPTRREKEVKVIYRILPPWGKSANGFFYYAAGMHNGFSVGGRNTAIPCPESREAEDKDKCPVCIFISRLKNSGDAAHSKLADRIRMNRRYFVNAIDLSEDAEDNDVKVFGTNYKFIEFILDSFEEYGDLTHPVKGRNITIIRTGRMLRTRYRYRVAKKATPVEYDPKSLYQLDKDIVNWMDYDSMVGYLQSNFGEELSEVGLKLKSGVKKKKKVKRDKDEDEDENEVEEDEDEDESTNEDDDNDGEDTEDEEEDEEQEEEDNEEEDDEEDEE